MLQSNSEDNFESPIKDIKRHEDNLKFLKSQANHLDESILDLQVRLGKYHSKDAASENSDLHPEEESTQQILHQEQSAAGILCKVKSYHAIHASNLSLIKDVLGIVATLARVDNDTLSRPFAGGFIANDPQKKLALLKPKLPDGKCPSGFLDFVVNMVNLDDRNLFCVTAGGHGLRETLFYNLFSYLQVYKTRADMLSALPCITHGALSLDGGMITKNGLFLLGSRENFEVKFPLITGRSGLSLNYSQIETRIRKLRWEQHNIEQDMLREQQLLDKARAASSGKPQV
uniref:Protein DEFECTIVE IN MERISTEM SILENCING 3 n=1 Tax=Populus trichocarpa TaxID=3694 RepID=A0A2K2BK73_POPTR|eukprot:XP_024450681.1 protein DEFECTIVE IN MERISTEM SILENCING 3 isoform X2 [Populus trichocarpa]